MDDIVTEFVIESLEGLDRLDNDFLALEKDPGDAELVANIFRCIHTIKGTCGFLAFSKLEAVTHAGESLLARLRDGTLAVTPEIINALLTLVDAVRVIMAHIENDGSEGEEDHDALIALLASLHPDSETATRAPTAPTKVAPLPDPELRATSADASIRVDVALLDKLMTLVGELVLARNQVLQYTSKSNNTPFNTTAQRLDHITSELQDSVMKTRMQPIGNVWSKFPRILRDLATTCGKQVRLELAGQETELDRTILEAIKDPLTHILRNAVDHGIERPTERIASNKPEEGTIVCRAYHEGGQVIIEITDDGRGIDPQRVLQKALASNLVRPDEAMRLSEGEILNLIFQPGFSTADEVTNISGRGVGMDVVRANIEGIGGCVDMTSTMGAGSSLKIKIPLTLAIIPALVVTCRGVRYALPQGSLLELVRLEGDAAIRGIERVRGVPVYRLRGHLLPLVHLDEVLGHDPVEPEAGEDPIVNIVILQGDGRRFGLIVDEINDTEEIVVKPLSKLLEDVVVFSGATIMGDGAVALILDVLGVALATGVAERGDRPVRESDGDDARPRGRGVPLLVAELGDGRRIALPLDTVARLEEIEVARIERSHGGDVVQHRGQILPLLHLADVVGVPRAEGENGILQVVVYAHDGSQVGLVVKEIVDIVDDDFAIQTFEPGGPIVGSVVIHDRVTDLLDANAAVEAANVRLYRAPVGEGLRP